MSSLAKPNSYGPGLIALRSNGANPTPARPRYLQSMSVSWKAKVDELYGNKRFAAATAQGQTSVTGKMEYGASNSRIVSDMLSGDVAATGQTTFYDDEAGALTTHTYQGVNNTGTSTDEGVRDGSNNVYTRVASGSEIAGKSYSYSGTTNTWTFNASEAGTGFKFSYSNTPLSPSSTASNVVLQNTAQGPTTNFAVDMVFPYGNEQ